MSDLDVEPSLTWPVPVLTRSAADRGRVARLSGLPEALRRKAWSEINQLNPALATLLKDPTIKEIMEVFDAELFIDAEFAPSLPPERL